MVWIQSTEKLSPYLISTVGQESNGTTIITFPRTYGTAARPVYRSGGGITGSCPLPDALKRAQTMEIPTGRCSESIGKGITC
jgi:predicted metal-binding protein